MKQITRILQIIVVGTLLAAAGCTELVDPGDAPYEQQLVVRAVLEPGMPIEAVFARSSPVTSTSIDIVRDGLEATITVDGVTHPLVTNTAPALAILASGESLKAEPGKVYRLDGRWSDGAFSATTRIPTPVEVVDSRNDISTTYNPQSDEFELTGSAWVDIRPTPGQVYLFRARTPGDSLGFSTFRTTEIRRASEAGADGILRLEATPRSFDNRTFSGTLIGTIEIFDEAYYDFYTSHPERWAEWAELDELTTQGRSIEWNVEGGAIGMFIGRFFQSVYLR